MSLPTLGEAYSLLADVRTTEIQRQREEEQEFQRQLRRDARRDQLRAAFFQPIAGAVATTGMKVLGDVVGGAFLGSNAVKKVTQQEQFRNLQKDVALQDKAIAGIADLAATTSKNPAKVKQDLLKLLRNQLAMDKYNQINFADLTPLQKNELSKLLTDENFQTYFNDTTEKLRQDVQKLNAELSTQFNSTKVAKFIKQNPDLYSAKSGGEKLFFAIGDKLASFIPGIEDRDRMRESYAIKLYGIKDEESLTNDQIENLDWLMGSTKEGTPVEGQGARNHAVYKEYKTKYDGLFNNFYDRLKENPGTNQINKNISLLESIDLAVQAAHLEDSSNVFTNDYYKSKDAYNKSDRMKEGIPFSHNPAPVFFTASDISNENLTDTIRASGPKKQQRYNAAVKKLEDATGLTESQVIETLQENIFPLLKNNFSDALNDMFRGTTYKGNAYYLLGSLNKSEQQALFGEFLVMGLEENVISVASEAGLFSKEEGALRIGLDKKSNNYESNNTLRILTILGEPEQYVEPAQVSTSSVSQANTNNLVKPIPSFVEIQGTVIGLTVQDVQKMKREGKSRKEIEDFITEKQQVFLQRINNSGIRILEDDLEISQEQFNTVRKISLKDYQQQPIMTRRGLRGSQSGTGVEGLLSDPILAFSKLRLRNQLENLENNPKPMQEFFRFFDPLDLAKVTPEVMKEVGYSDEFIEYAQQITKDSSDSLLSDPNEKISIDSVLETAFENQALNPITIDLFTDNPNGMTLPAVESAASLSVADRSNLTSDHDAHGITQIKVSTAVQPGYNTPNIFKVADSLGVTYDEDLAQEAMAITAKGAVSQQKMTEEEGPAWQQVVDLLRNPEVNVRLGALYFNNLLKNYNNNPVKAVIAYNAGPAVSNSFTGDRSVLRQETQDYLSKMGL